MDGGLVEWSPNSANVTLGYAVQGSQFTSLAFIKMLKDAKIKISMDG